jgi:serine protease Do
MLQVKEVLAMKRINIMNLLSLSLIVLLALTTACELPLSIDISVPADHLSNRGISVSASTDSSLLASESVSPVLPDIAGVVAAVKPSVVAINTETTVNTFRHSFTQEGAGSGWIIDENGTIVTNNHVVAGAESITITLDDGRTLPVDMHTLATDPPTDLAVFQIDAENLPPAPIGDSSALRVGDWLVAIGNSLGLGISATAGIASGLGISLELSSGQELYDLIQTDAAINPGNSGGPLVNMAGQVIGITSVKIAAVGVEGLGYAISIDEATPIIEKLTTGLR